MVSYLPFETEVQLQYVYLRVGTPAAEMLAITFPGTREPGEHKRAKKVQRLQTKQQIKRSGEKRPGAQRSEENTEDRKQKQFVSPKTQQN